MKRRDTLLLLLSIGVLSGPSPAAAQPAGPVRRIALLVPGSREALGPLIDTFMARLKELGYVEGRDIAIEARWTDGKVDRLPALAAEIVALNPAVIVTGGSAAIRAVKTATQSVPVVFATASEPDTQGFVASLGRPGGNITGVVISEQMPNKVAELIRETIPWAARVAVLVHDADPFSPLGVKQFERPASVLGFEVRAVYLKHADDLEKAFADIAGHKPDALFVPSLALFQVLRSRIADLALKARLPLFSIRAEQTLAGGLLSYSQDIHENYRRAASLVDKILRGTKPAELPVEQPERFQFVINLKTAKALGITIPQSVLWRADRVIE